MDMKGEKSMSPRVRRVLKALKGNVQRNSPRIRKKLSKSGAIPDPAVVFSTAKYYKALNKLAKE
jgi:hypothetical protein